MFDVIFSEKEKKRKLFMFIFVIIAQLKQDNYIANKQ